MIQAVGFDYGGVIGGVGSTGVNFTEQISEILGVDKETYREVYFSMNHLINMGEIDSWREFWRLLVDEIGKPEKYDEVIALNEKSEKHLQEVDQRMLALVDDLRARGYKTGLLSNTTAESGRVMRSQGINQHFDAFHISAEIKLMKPDPQAFEHLAEALSVRPTEMAFVDDAEKSLSTAGEVGFTPVHFTSYEDLKRQLAALQIKI